MSVIRASGFWDMTHSVLALIGRGTACVVPGQTQAEDDVCTITGGAVAGGILGAVAGLLLSDPTQKLNIAVSALLGVLLGACSGVMYAAIVEVVDDSIKDFLNSNHPR